MLAVAIKDQIRCEAVETDDQGGWARSGRHTVENTQCHGHKQEIEVIHLYGHTPLRTQGSLTAATKGCEVMHLAGAPPLRTQRGEERAQRKRNDVGVFPRNLRGLRRDCNLVVQRGEHRDSRAFEQAVLKMQRSAWSTG
jgi:hypothetical protein